MTPRIRVGVVGGGLVAQMVHLPNLRLLSDQFEIAGIADASSTVARGLAQRYPEAHPYTDWTELLDREQPEAVLICSPHHTHAEVALEAIARGIHAFVEKPLCITPDDGETIARRARQEGVVVQVGYMKRYEPAYQGFLEALPSSIDDLRFISVSTYDPSLAREPFIREAELIRAHDVSETTIRDGQRSERDQVLRAVGHDDPDSTRAFSHTFLACLIHDVNLVHGALDRMGVTERLKPRAAAHWAGGDGASLLVDLPNGALWSCTWLLLPGIDAFSEQITFHLSDSLHTLVFPSPYDPTLAVHHSIDRGEGRCQITESTGGGFVSELRHFHSAIRDDAPCHTPPEQALDDMALLRDAFQRVPASSAREAASLVPNRGGAR